mgnify:FL=1|jgi:hypothetical protein
MCVCVDGHIFDWERSDGKAIDTTAGWKIQKIRLDLSLVNIYICSRGDRMAKI